MGIQGLSKAIADYAPSGMKETELSHYFGRKIAIDASMCLYQFLTAVRIEGLELQSEDGETTSHLMGIFYSTIRLMENGIKPLYVFDGVPPDLKSGELQKRKEKREKNRELLKKAEEAGDAEGIERFSKRMAKVTGAIVDETIELLTLMGVPTFEAPGEAEAQCAELVRSGKVYACASEDMDALTFGAKILLRHVTVSAAKKLPIVEYNLEKILAELKLTRDEFIDFSILLGCDYCESIRGAGMVRSFQLIKAHRNIETILEKMDKTKYTAPENWIYKEARKLFQKPDVADTTEMGITWINPDEEGLVKFLCGKRNFNETRVRNGVKKLMKARSTATQGRLDSFFTVTPSTNGTKRKAEEKPDGNKKAKKGAPAGKFKGKRK